MKQLLIAFVLLLSFQSFAQLQVKKASPATKIGSVNSGGRFLAELSYKVEEGDTTYTLMYRNCEYKQILSIESVKFNSEGGTVEQLYTILKSVFSDENKKNKEYKVELRLGDTDVIISNFRMMGVSSAMFSTTKGYVYLTEGQLDKLFGKK